MYSLILKWKGQFRRGKAANVERRMTVVNLVQGKVASAKELADSSVYIRKDSGSALTHSTDGFYEILFYIKSPSQIVKETK